MTTDEAFESIVEQISALEGATIAKSDYSEHFGDFCVLFRRGGKASALVNERRCILLYPNHEFEDGVVLVQDFYGMVRQDLSDVIARALASDRDKEQQN